MVPEFIKKLISSCNFRINNRVEDHNAGTQVHEILDQRRFGLYWRKSSTFGNLLNYTVAVC